METRAPYHTAPAAPKAPCNLAPRLGEWLRAQGFALAEQAFPTLTVLTAHWTSPRQELFELTYTWQAGPVADATCQLRVLHEQPEQRVDMLVLAQRVGRLKHVRRLLRDCVRYHNARLLAGLAPSPAP